MNEVPLKKHLVCGKNSCLKHLKSQWFIMSNKVWSLVTLTSQRCLKYLIYLNTDYFVIQLGWGIWMGFYTKSIVLFISYGWLQSMTQKVTSNFLQNFKSILDSNTLPFLNVHTRRNEETFLPSIDIAIICNNQ